MKVMKHGKEKLLTKKVLNKKKFGDPSRGGGGEDGEGGKMLSMINER